MTPLTVGIICIILMFILIFARTPIAIAMALPGILGAVYIRGWDSVGSMLNTVVWDNSASYIFSTIPMFVLMGELLFAANITKELYNSLRSWVGSIKGGMGIATIGASALFAATSGSSIAATGTMGVIATKEMRENGYSNSLASGTVVAGGTLGILIPPSTAFIIYGLITDQSIGRLLIAGIIPGIILTLAYSLVIYLSAVFRPAEAPTVKLDITFIEKIKSLKSTIWFILLFLVVIGGMYVGFFSPTESAGVGAFFALLICIIKGDLTLKKTINAFVRTVHTTSFIFAIILGAYILSYFLSLTRLPILLSEWITSTDLSPYTILFFIIILYIFFGMVMDLTSMIVITMPVFLPTLIALDFDLIWFGVVVVILIEMALITPPIGLNCFVLQGAVPDLKLGEIFKGATRFIVAQAVVLLIIIVFKELSVFLPNMLM